MSFFVPEGPLYDRLYERAEGSVSAYDHENVESQLRCTMCNSTGATRAEVRHSVSEVECAHNLSFQLCAWP